MASQAEPHASSSAAREMAQAYRQSLIGWTSPLSNTCSTLPGERGFTRSLFAQRQPMLRATVFDLPPLVPFTQEIIAHYDMQERVTPCPGNYFHDDFAGGNDLVLLSNTPQTEGVDTCRMLLGKVFKARGGWAISAPWPHAAS